MQRIREAKDTWRDTHETVPDNVLVDLPACVRACPADAMTFGNLKDPDSKVSQQFKDPRAYTMLGELNTKSAVRYLARVSHNQPSGGGHGGEHGGGH